MKRPLLNSAIVAISLAFFASCKSSDSDSNFPTKFSSNTVEENKTNLENNGIDMVNNLTDLKNTTGIQATINFSKLSTVDNSTARQSTSGSLNFIHSLANFGQGKISAQQLLSTMSDGPSTLGGVWDSLIGVHTFHRADSTWTFEKTGDKIVFKFPSTSTGVDNDAEYDIYGYKSVQITSNIGGSNYTGDYPTALNADLLIGGAKKAGFKFTAAYNSEGDPSALTIAYSIDDYTLTYSFSNTTSEIKSEYTLTKGSKTLLGFGVSSTGTFSSDALTNSGSAVTDVKTGSAYFRIENIQFSAKVNLEKIQSGITPNMTLQQTVDLYNANYKIVVFYIDSKKKIADSEFYVTSDDTVDLRLIFADGSKSDIDTYTSAGFEDFKNAVDDFTNDTSGS